MSSNGPDRTNSGSIWQGPINGANGVPMQPPFNATPPSPQQPFHADPAAPMIPDAQPLQYDTSGPLPPFPPQYPMEDFNDVDVAEEEIASAEPFEAPASRIEILAQVGQYVSLVLAPLLFGGLTCLFVLPLVANGRAKIPPEGLWPLALVIIAIAVGQGVAVYYAGSNNVLWAVSTVAAFFLFLLVGCFAIFGMIPGLFLLALFMVLAIVLARLYVRSVPEGTVDMVYLFGKYSRTLYPGLNILLPWEKVRKRGIKVTEQTWTSPLLRVQMSRTEDIEISAIVSYQLVPEDAYIAVTQVSNWEASLYELFNTNIKNIATTLAPDDLLAWQRGLRSRPSATMNGGIDSGPRWERINNSLFQHMRDKVALWGVQINWTRVREVKLMPHGATTLESVGADAADSRASSTATTAPEGIVSSKQNKAATANKNAAPAVELPKISNEVLESVLTKAYREVQSGKVTDPDTIRRLAQQFEAVARDPEKNQHVSFDATRAALNLYSEAEQNELLTPRIYNDETKTDWNLRRPNDDNMMAGG